ncbi:MAG TPA: RagB/SusD family nutrient uptake outer membrane protein [Cyclobacteriaceae bacterium]
MKEQIMMLLVALMLPILMMVSCEVIEEPLQNNQLEGEVDYTKSEDMILIIQGAYSELNFNQWETFPLLGVRGDDVNAAGDQFPLQETDAYRYDRNFWMYNSSWLNYYSEIISFNGAIEAINLYKENGASAELADQYIAEVRVMRGFSYLQLARLWGEVIITTDTEISALPGAEISTFEEVMQFVSDEMDESMPDLLAVRPNQRTDIENGITRYAALAIKAHANLELKNWQAAADATGEIISSGLFELFDDYYELFNIPGKNNNGTILSFQYSDFGTSSGTAVRYLYNFFGPSDYEPVVEGVLGGWGFWEPTEKYIKFMLARGEQERLIGTVAFTPDGMASLEADIGPLPDFITNIAPSGDEFPNHPRYNFLSIKYILPSDQLTPGRTQPGHNNNFKTIRYSEVLLMHAEALASGATSSAMSAVNAVNMVRDRVGMPPLASVTLDDVLDEKYAELATEWGHRYYDLERHDRESELNHQGWTYNSGEHRFLPYPLPQLDLLPQLKDNDNLN